MARLDSFTIHIYPTKAVPYEIKGLQRREAFLEARKHLLKADQVIIRAPTGTIIYQHRKPHLRHLSVLKATK